MLQRVGARASKRTATEHSRGTAKEHCRGAKSEPVRTDSEADYASCRSAWKPNHRTATEHSLTASRELDPMIRLQKSRTPTTVRNWKDCHNREPDVGIGILIFIPSYRAGERLPGMTEYCGKYLGHGQSKTAFELSCPGARFHGNVIKVAKETDMEPSVFMKATPLHLTMSILFEVGILGIDSPV